MNIFIIFFALVLLSALPGPAADEQKIIVFSGSSRTFYCKESFNIENCFCKPISSCSNMSASTFYTYEVEPHLGNSKITVPGLSLYDDKLCYRCGKQEYHFELRQEICPSVVIGKPGGSVMMSCTMKWRSSDFQYWCRKDQSRSCSGMNLSSLWRQNQDSKGASFLEKRNLSTEDSGTYQCVFKRKTCDITLELLQSQNGLHAPATFNVMPGQQVKIACKYIQDYVNASKFWECSNYQFSYRSCSTVFEVEDDRSRSELVLSIADVKTTESLNVFTCKVETSAGGFHTVSTTLMVGLTAQLNNLTGTRGDRITMRCQYLQEYFHYGKYWCKLTSSGKCGEYFIQGYKYEDRSIFEGSDYFDLILERLQRDDAGSYRCGFYYYIHNYIYHTEIKADVHLSIIEPPIPSTTTTTTTTRKTVIQAKTRSPTKPEASFRSNSLLYGIFVLLTFIAVILLVILLKLYCKRRRERVQSPDLVGGTFQMNDLKTNIHLMSPDLPVHQQPYTGTMDDDSSSTSSESSGHSFGNISFGPRPHYLTIAASPRNPDYENVSEEMHPALSDYENVTTDIEQDYVNVPEAPNSSVIEDKESEACQPTKNCEKSDNTSESSSDESDEESVNYSKVVFTKTTE